MFINLFSELCFFSEMEFCETPHTLCSGYQTDMHSVSRHGYQLEMGSDVDTETEGAASPDHALRMWIRGMKSEHSSCLSSRANSALSLTDTDHERKSDGENGNRTIYIAYIKPREDAGFSLWFVFLPYVCLPFISSAEWRCRLAGSHGQGMYLSIWQIDTFVYNNRWSTFYFWWFPQGK